MNDIAIVTCSAPINIAIVKYWGKRDNELILPINSSLSTTLSQDDFKTVTTVMASKSFQRDRVWLNGIELDKLDRRLQNCIRNLREKANERKNERNFQNMCLHICSYNNFPTSAGLASSASGYACLVYAIASLFHLEERWAGELSTCARLGSGSACRSMYGGWVKWEKGRNQADGNDSIAVQIADQRHWPDIVVLILVFSQQQKPISSTEAMQRSMETSTLLPYRAEHIVHHRIELLENAIMTKNFDTFAKLVMQESNQFHAICLDTYPPIMYLNEQSKSLIKLLSKYNEYHKMIKAAYTFDAGPNAVIYTLKENFQELKRVLNYYYPRSEADWEPELIPDQLSTYLDLPVIKNALKHIIYTNIGGGPKVWPSGPHLLDIATGLPYAEKVHAPPPEPSEPF
ncbi:diphosphomevalonate decarboxylase-like [Schistocerca gregaria]|uniref:diphosphomevalonate decarboxylase-like n=1 Tax=Schistocerca gregaria TaxID=7010 RepID=UPI00211DEAC0|nr:diphosphomevalonate decarboxylase-like [Schistocerca gregaria]